MEKVAATLRRPQGPPLLLLEADRRRPVALPIHDTHAPPPFHRQANHFDMPPPSDEPKRRRQRLRGFQLHLLGPEGAGDRAGRLPAPLRWGLFFLTAPLAITSYHTNKTRLAEAPFGHVGDDNGPGSEPPQHDRLRY
ncbi:hypothetical protein THAOC_22832, partial [Thalassiosira oceanica]